MVSTARAAFFFAFLGIFGGTFTDCKSICKVPSSSNSKGIQEVACHHGECSHTGCVCDPCWAGLSCDIAEVARFTHNTYTFTIPLDRARVLPEVHVLEKDAEKCKDCACRGAQYELKHGDVDDLFRVDSKTGDISYKPPSTGGPSEKQYNLTISASFPGMQKTYSRYTTAYTHVIINLKDTEVAKDAFDGGRADKDWRAEAQIKAIEEGIQREIVQDEQELESLSHLKYKDSSKAASRRLLAEEDSGDVVLSRHKRGAGDGFPAKMTLALQKIGDWDSQTTIRVGNKISFNLTIWMPANTTTMRIEIYTPINDTAVMSICSPKIVQKGSNFDSLDVNTVDFSRYSKMDDYKYDRAVIDFGTITNDGVDNSDPTASKIVLEFDVLVEDAASLVDGDEYWVAVGASFYSGTTIWVSQADFVVDVDAALASGVPPSFNFTGPTELPKGQVGVWKLDMSMHDLYNNVTVEVYAPLNQSNIMSVCRISIEQTGENYNCLPRDRAKLSFIKEQNNGSSANNKIATLAIGQIINTGFRTSTNTDNNAANTISLEIVTEMLNSSEVIPGTAYWLGASIQVDRTTIWSAQLEVNALEEQITNLTLGPAMSLSTVSQEVVIGGQTAFLLNMTLPSQSTTTYKVEVAIPQNSSSKLTNCRLLVTHVGFNMPCVRISSPQYISANSDEMFDYVSLDFGFITNTGQRSTVADNTIQIEMVATVVAGSGIVENDTLSFISAVRYNMGVTNMIWVGMNNIVVKDEPPSYTGSLAPVFSFHNMMKNNLLYNHSAAVYWLEMTLPATTYYDISNVEMTVPRTSDGKPMFDICKAEIIHLGRNYACVNTSGINFTFVTEPGAATPYKAQASLGLISNIGSKDWSELKNDSIIRIQFVIEMTDNTLFPQDNSTDLDNTTWWVGAGIKYRSDKIWVAQSSVNYSHEIPYIQNGTNDPIVTLGMSEISNPLMAYRESPVAFTVNLTMPVASVADLNYEVTLDNDTTSGLSVCRVRMKKRGKHLTCGGLELDSAYYNYDNNLQINRGTADIIGVSNASPEPITNENAADNILGYEVVVKVANASGDYFNGSSHGFVVAVTSGMQRLWMSPNFILVNDGTPPPLDALPDVSLGLRGGGSVISKGTAQVFELVMYIPPKTNAPITVEFYAPWNTTHVGQFQTCDIRLSTVGWNIPCTNDTTLTRNYSSAVEGVTYYSDATLDVSYVSSLAQDGAVVHEDNKMVFEFTTQLPLHSTIVSGDKVYVAATVKAGDTKLWVGQIFVTVQDITLSEQQGNVTLTVDEIDDTDIRTYGDSNPGVFMRIGQERDFKFNVSLLDEFSTAASIYIETPFEQDEPLVTIGEIFYSYHGDSIGCGPEKNITPSYESDASYTTTQMNKVTIDLGVLTNVGTRKRYEFLPQTTGDVTVQLVVRLRLTDHRTNVNNRALNVSVKLDYSNGRSLSIAPQITVFRDGSEKPEMLIKLWTDDLEPCSFMNIGKQITLYGLFNHTINSTARAYNASFWYRLPWFFEFVSVIGYGGRTPNFTNNGNAGLLFYYDQVKFSDNNTVTINATIDPNKLLAIGQLSIPTIISGDVTYEYGSIASSTEEYLDQYQHAFRVCSPEMFEELGMSSGSIKDCQLTASSSQTGHTPEKARPGHSGSWMTTPRGPPFFTNDFIQVKLGNTTRVTGVSLMTDGSDPTLYVTGFTLQYSQDGQVWRHYLKNGTERIKLFNVAFNTSFLNASIPYEPTENDVAFVPIIPPITGRFLRIVPKTNSKTGWVHAARFELLGGVMDTSASEEVCDEVSLPSYSYYERSYLYADGSLFVCMVQDVEGGMQCSVSKDCGSNWKRLDEQVLTVEFHVTVSIANEETLLFEEMMVLYGVARNRRSHTKSTDLGRTWCNVIESDYTEAKDTAGAVMAKILPFDSWQNINVQTLYDSYGTLTETGKLIGGSHRGMHCWANQGALSADAALNGTNLDTALQASMKASWGTAAWNTVNAPLTP